MGCNHRHHPLQSAYKVGRITETALTKLQNDILCSVDKYAVAIHVFTIRYSTGWD